MSLKIFKKKKKKNEEKIQNIVAEYVFKKKLKKELKTKTVAGYV